MSKNIARCTAALFIAAGAMSISAPAMAADSVSIDRSSLVEIQPKDNTYQPAIWAWPQRT